MKREKKDEKRGESEVGREREMSRSRERERESGRD